MPENIPFSLISPVPLSFRENEYDHVHFDGEFGVINLPVFYLWFSYSRHW